MKRIIDYSEKNKLEQEQKDIFSYIKDKGLVIFPYAFAEKYNKLNQKIKFDNNFPYVVYEGKKLYFLNSWSLNQVKYYFNSLLVEQESTSPHRYCTDGFEVESDDVLIDLGAAEGNFSLENVDKAKKTILFERKQEWVEALAKTFKTYGDKVQIINKYVGILNDDKHISLDALEMVKNENLFIKIDVDGSERDVLKGMEGILNSPRRIKIAICTYHNQNDAYEFQIYFEERGFKTSFSSGYMLFFHDNNIKAPFLRKGVLRAIKNL
ncbi:MULTISPECIES: FkbM family methyltransferase [Rhodonellum]|uniref:FkbM family methyltransferase n=1 Tax=Rhodonellum TaxID=336827 RepID=UPI0004084FAA|nr:MULTISPECIES: FkbM family methyltransferase [Rhodonellum]